ncbi:MAG: aldehyde dehydrogenase family protein [Clostridiales bacterium]|nr:aldehyde dehydrogenase family protein [Clostridiales bacterium]
MPFATAPEYERIAQNLRFNLKALIGGKLVDAMSGERFETASPATGKTIASVANCGAADVEAAVAAARRAFSGGAWSRADPAARKSVLFKLADLIEKHGLDLAVMESIDSGKPIRDTLEGDIPETVGCFRFAAEAIDKLNDEVTPTADDCLNIVRREPIGVCAAILPWNFPILMAAWKLAPILAAGNCVVAKPAKLTSLTLLKLAELSLEAGLPAGVLNVVPGSGGVVGDALANHMDVDLITFTGSTAVGKNLLKCSAASNAKRVLLEMGGKNPCVVMPGISDLDWAAEQIVQAGLWNMGENCTQNSRVILHKDIHDKLVPKILDQAKAWKTGNPLDPGNRLGPVIERAHMEAILGYVEKGKAEGAKLLCGGRRILEDTGGYFVEPCVFDGASQGMAIAKEEIFGPVFAILSFSGIDEAIAMANDTEYGLQASVWSDNINEAIKLSRGIKAGVVSVNHFSEGDITTPFGGFKQSGFMSRDKSVWANRQYTELKSVFIKTR